MPAVECALAQGRDILLAHREFARLAERSIRLAEKRTLYDNIVFRYEFLCKIPSLIPSILLRIPFP